MGSKMITDITSTQTTINDTDNFILQETAGGTTKKTLWSTIKSNLKTYFDSLYAPIINNTTGWITAGETWTYASADDPTYTFTVSGDVTSKYSVGMKIKLTQTTVKYFIITAISYGSPNTTITIYGGTDYTLTDSTISSPYYSTHKAPYGFPLDPDKWSITMTDTSTRSQSSPVSGTWYNLGSLSINIPIGIWVVSYQVSLVIYRSTSTYIVNGYSSLSTASSSESDSDFTTYIAGHTYASGTFNRKKTISLSATQTYYLIAKQDSGASINSISFEGGSKMIINAICAYL